MESNPEQAVRAWVEYLREMGVYDLYQRPEPGNLLSEATLSRLRTLAAAVPAPQAHREAPGLTGVSRPSSAVPIGQTRGSPRPAPLDRPPRDVVAAPLTPVPGPPLLEARPPAPADARAYFNAEPEASQTLPPELAAPMPKPQPLASLLPVGAPLAPADRAAALERLRAEIGDCTRCPLAYAGRHHIVFGTGDPNARLLFVGEGPGADEDATGEPFVGKAGQLLNNMISAMGLAREQVYIANIVKCRPPGNRAPEYVEATTCSPFLLRQIDIVRPRVIVALGMTAATYVLGVKQSLASLRGQWFSVRDAKVAVTYHPAFLLRDPRQKPEAWKDLQRVMAELGLAPPSPRRS